MIALSEFRKSFLTGMDPHVRMLSRNAGVPFTNASETSLERGTGVSEVSFVERQDRKDPLELTVFCPLMLRLCGSVLILLQRVKNPISGLMKFHSSEKTTWIFVRRMGNGGLWTRLLLIERLAERLDSQRGVG
eukprot:scaffold2122_cov122-Cylindrotheca_fusiformis.AAC.1